MVVLIDFTHTESRAEINLKAAQMKINLPKNFPVLASLPPAAPMVKPLRKSRCRSKEVMCTFLEIFLVIVHINEMSD
jgi:hypothetical protein